MKKLLILVAVGMALMAQGKSPEGMKLVWQENFNGKTLDTAVWSKIPRGTADWDNYMSDFDSLYSFSKGRLVLHGIQNTTQKGDTAAYLTGGVWTKDKHDFQNGRLEIRARLESAQGAWPAFWMLGNAKWPDGGEIDIMEHLNYDSVVYQTVHSVYTLKHGIKDNPRSGTVPRIDPAGWNTYGVEIGPDSLSLFVNGKKTLCYPKIETPLDGQYPFGNACFLLLDMQLGGSWVGAVDPATLPVKMEIDYVKFYQKK